MLRFRTCVVSFLLLAASGAAFGRTTSTYVGAAIPRTISLPSAGIFSNSDSLFLNQRLLIRGNEYVISEDGSTIDLTSLEAKETDTLIVVFSEMPLWLRKVYGRDIPDASDAATPALLPSDLGVDQSRGAFAKDLRLSGAKTFRFSSRTQGDADFGQSLDLKISGELSPGLELTGALSDRGYDPAYGTATSRLNELDKLNLQLHSERLLARIGDISLSGGQEGAAKNVSGASFLLNFPNWQAHAAAARPRGRFESTSFSGQDSFQGPYRVGSQNSANPIVPGSEIVWLDGRQMERGAEKDYTVDYPAGTITFTVRHPIDRRSRIETDFEPLATSYRQELLSLGGGVSIKDSMLYVTAGVVREGDDREQLLIGELTDAERLALERGGDVDIFESGITADTSGDYVLVVDSLPDSVFSYVGSGKGDYRILFSYVGAGEGEYRYVGGNSYEFVGTSKGDYLPVRRIPRPERADFYQSTVGLKTRYGRLTADIRQTSLDRNLWSSLDDANNDGLFYQLEYVNEWKWDDQASSIKLRRRLREPTFATRERLVDADFNRTYMVPFGWNSARDELIHSAELTLSPESWLKVAPRWSRIEYKGEFGSSVGGLDVELRPIDRLRLSTQFRMLESELDSGNVSHSGEARGFAASAKYQFFREYAAGGTFERDRREYSYSGSLAGLRYDRYELQAGSPTESIRYERYIEDSLETAWFESGTRDRVSAHSIRQLGNLNINSELAWQQLDNRQRRESNFLGRATLAYNDAPHRLQLQTSYVVSQELRNERGITYLEVEPGRGNYSLEDGKYVPDPFGNYIQVEELLSDRAEVRRGEKSFQFSKDLTVVNIRFSSNIREELLESGERKLWWIIPFLTDESQPYLFFSRRYDSEIRLVPWRNFYAINLSISDDIERRAVAGSANQRRDSRASVTLKQAASALLFEQSGEYFRSDRDQYYIGAGTVDGFRLSALVRRVTSTLEWNSGAAIRRANSSADDSADLYSLLAGVRIKALGKGEVRTDLELYRQLLDISGADYTYQLTDNRYGKRGAIWTIGVRYGVRPGIQVNVNFQGRHSEDRSGRVSGRGEVVASF